MAEKTELPYDIELWFSAPRVNTIRGPTEILSTLKVSNQKTATSGTVHFTREGEVRGLLSGIALASRT